MSWPPHELLLGVTRKWDTLLCVVRAPARTAPDAPGAGRTFWPHCHRRRSSAHTTRTPTPPLPLLPTLPPRTADCLTSPPPPARSSSPRSPAPWRDAATASPTARAPARHRPLRSP